LRLYTEARVEAALRSTEVALGGAAIVGGYGDVGGSNIDRLRGAVASSRTQRGGGRDSPMHQTTTPARSGTRSPSRTPGSRRRMSPATAAPANPRPGTAPYGGNTHGMGASQYSTHGTPAFGASGLQRPDVATKGTTDVGTLKPTPPARRGEHLAYDTSAPGADSPRVPGAKKIVGGGFRRRPESAIDGGDSPCAPPQTRSPLTHYHMFTLIHSMDTKESHSPAPQFGCVEVALCFPRQLMNGSSSVHDLSRVPRKCKLGLIKLVGQI
jgi:hypothetical protein